MKDGRIDRVAWRETVFLPMSLITDGRTHVIEDEDAFKRGLDDLENYAQAKGMTHFRTRILSHISLSDSAATIAGLRDHMTGEKRLATASMTFSVLRDGNDWRINQIHFNDHTADLSATTQIFRQSGEG